MKIKHEPRNSTSKSQNVNPEIVTVTPLWNVTRWVQNGQWLRTLLMPEWSGSKEMFLFNDTLNTFYLRLYGVRHMV